MGEFTRNAVCVSKRRGPTCHRDSDCIGLSGCVRCAHSGHCANGPLLQEDDSLLIQEVGPWHSSVNGEMVLGAAAAATTLALLMLAMKYRCASSRAVVSESGCYL